MSAKIDSILNLSESANVEFKQEIPAKDDLISLLCAFANTAGGDLHIGISNKIPRKIVVIPEIRK